MIQAPGIQLKLLPNGQLCAALPHEDGTSLTVALPTDSKKLVERVTAILQAQLNGIRKETGRASAPTQWNIIQDAMEKAGDFSRTVKGQAKVIAVNGTGANAVVVRRVPTKSKKIQGWAPSLAELGLL